MPIINNTTINNTRDRERSEPSRAGGTEGLRDRDRFIGGLDSTVDHFLATLHYLLINQVGILSS